MRNEGVTIQLAPLGRLKVGQRVVVYIGGSPHPGTVTKLARVNIVIEFETDTRAGGAMFRRDTQEGEDAYGKMRFRTLEQDELEKRAEEGLTILADAGVSLDFHARLDAAQIVALTATVLNHRAFSKEAGVA